MIKYLFFISVFSVFAVSSAKAQPVTSPPGSISGIVIYKARVAMKGDPTLDTLRFNRQKYFFQWQRRMETVTNSTSINGSSKTTATKKVPPLDSIGEYNLYNLVDDSLYSRIFMLDHVYILKEGAPDIRWTITDSTKKIGSYTCTKATAAFRGRHYVAWFTPQIPVPYGPWKLIGLPGLIIKAHDKKNNIQFNTVKLRLDVKVSPNIKMPLNGNEKVINLKEYKYLLAHRYKKKKKQIRENTLKKIRKLKQKFPQISAHISSVQVGVPQPMEIFSNNTNQQQ